jgi:hypothetical protein
MSDAPPFRLPVHPDAENHVLEELRLGDDETNGDTLHDHGVRAQYAVVALQAYQDLVPGMKAEPTDAVIRDFLLDLRHACEALGLDFADLVEESGTHYGREIRGVI